jgi:hypothetical protein
MNESEEYLWRQIETFEMDSKQAAFSFSKRLARENNWSISYSKRVIEEYKKFIFLNSISENGLTPSDAVDQAWHLHLTYTQSYWKELCGKVLKKELHHNPTKGGKTEGEKFNNYYTTTKLLYSEKFKREPPVDIWPSNQERFTDIQFQRINVSRNFILKKSSLYPLLLAVISIGIMGVFIQAISENYTLTLLIFAAIIGYVIYQFIKDNKSNNGGNGCSSGGGCGSGCANSVQHNSHDGDSGCSGSGCSGSGCSGSGCGGD